ncbi:LuxR family transcriptional regulator [Candidatus Liberibacter solanacearum]|uniref:Putative deoxyribonuclease YcfH n=1 Tax=Candidatus Liberibacter solanacearum TaxID=556287 RepID=A0A094Z0T2_9HYPH|nr:TatD family hydrolase [Candidatus Liberibacter solanacearum]KGB27800.1 LuxR family transcriptional regulator [Candidatus Liberibacter solanacearum]KJZ82463.1 putative deoxyribonuclease YcfH [Candidatus Liberibacter solanacearum]KQC48760.1 LuxR family transcriptional regulator [Candidatus Liberibacter solanacearum]
MLIDTHCHLALPDFDGDRHDVIMRSHKAGVLKMIAIAIKVKDFVPLITLCQDYPSSVFCSIGTHPCHAHEELEVLVDELVCLASHPRVVAIGETGLDRYHNAHTIEDQKTVFLRHIEAARITGIPLVIHSRSADEDMVALLQEQIKKGPFSFVIHCFSSSQKLADICLELGGYISFSGMITFPKYDDLRVVAQSIPMDRLLVETDSPYIVPVPCSGRRNEPSYVVNTAKVLAREKGISYEELMEKTTENAFRLFSKMSKCVF